MAAFPKRIAAGLVPAGIGRVGDLKIVWYANHIRRFDLPQFAGVAS